MSGGGHNRIHERARGQRDTAATITTAAPPFFIDLHVYIYIYICLHVYLYLYQHLSLKGDLETNPIEHEGEPNRNKGNINRERRGDNRKTKGGPMENNRTEGNLEKTVGI